MKLDNNYDSRIGKLFPNQMDNYFFISDWDLHNPQFMYDVKSFYTMMSDNSNLSINDYYFVNERLQDKLWLEEMLDLRSMEWYKSLNFSIFPNGTSAASILLQTLNKKNNLRALLLSPTYFTYIDVLKDMNCDIHYHSLLSYEGNYIFNINDISEIVTDSQINIIILTYPLFGSGICVSFQNLQKLSSFCKVNNIFLLIDYIYGGIDWNDYSNIFPYQLMQSTNNATAVLLSLSKNLFLNGAKTCLLFACNELIERVEKQSVYALGSMAQSQIASLRMLYDIKNRNSVLALQNEIKLHIQNSFQIIKSLCALRNYRLTKSNSGIFTLAGIPRDNFKKKDDDEIAKIILKSSGVLTIPHSRYLFYSDNYYWFRINLSYQNQKLFPEFQKLIQINFD